MICYLLTKTSVVKTSYSMSITVLLYVFAQESIAPLIAFYALRLECLGSIILTGSYRTVAGHVYISPTIMPLVLIISRCKAKLTRTRPHLPGGPLDASTNPPQQPWSSAGDLRPHLVLLQDSVTLHSRLDLVEERHF